MIAGEIGEHSHVKGHTEDALLRQGVRGNFHHRVSRSLAERFAEQSSQFQCLRSRVRRGIHSARDVVFNRADESALSSRGRENRFDQKRSRTLPVGSGDASDCDSFRRTLVEILADARQRAPAVRYQRPRDSFARLFDRRIGDHRDGSRLDRLIDEAVAIGSFTVHGHEYAARLDPPRVIFHTGDVRVPALAEELGAIQQMLKSHCLKL